MTICKPYDETTADDFKHLFVERFPDGDVALLDAFLANPARRVHPSSGSVAYEADGAVKAILGLVPRIVYCGRNRVPATNGVAIAVRKDADRAFFPDFIRDAVRDDGAEIFFVNTAIPPSRKRVQAVLGVLDGPESCAEIRERAVRSNGRVARAMRKVAARLGMGAARLGMGAAQSSSVPYCVAVDGLSVAWEREIAEDDFDRFWAAYLVTNEGLVSSRTAEELRWMFAKGLACGEVVLLTARKGGTMQGYAFCRRTDDSASCWRVVDWIALRNDEKVLEALIEGATQFLRARTPALCLQITGYPTWVQPLLRRLFPAHSPFGFNKCVWVYLNERVQALCGDWLHAPKGWYGCPYDGDMCLM